MVMLLVDFDSLNISIDYYIHKNWQVKVYVMGHLDSVIICY
jgi:hypothetical protein